VEALVAHLELSFSEPQIPAVEPVDFAVDDPLRSMDRWSAATVHAAEACLVLNELLDIVAVSPSAAQLLGATDPSTMIGCNLLAGIIRLVDFNQQPQPLPQGEVEKTPPVLARETGRLARGLLRVQHDDRLVTIDAIATPLLDGDTVVGSLTFLAEI
jgi:PAS domain-containing protein